METRYLMFPAENLEKRKCWDNQRGQMIFFENNENKCKCKVRNLEQPFHFNFILNGMSTLFIRQAIESKIHRYTVLNLSPHCAFSLITLILAVPSAAGKFANCGSRRKLSTEVQHYDYAQLDIVYVKDNEIE